MNIKTNIPAERKGVGESGPDRGVGERGARDWQVGSELGMGWGPEKRMGEQDQNAGGGSGEPECGQVQNGGKGAVGHNGGGRG